MLDLQSKPFFVQICCVPVIYLRPETPALEGSKNLSCILVFHIPKGMSISEYGQDDPPKGNVIRHRLTLIQRYSPVTTQLEKCLLRLAANILGCYRHWFG